MEYGQPVEQCYTLLMTAHSIIRKNGPVELQDINKCSVRSMSWCRFSIDTNGWSGRFDEEAYKTHPIIQPCPKLQVAYSQSKGSDHEMSCGFPQNSSN